MRPRVLSRQSLRRMAAGVAAILIVEISPVPVLAARSPSPPAPAPAAVPVVSSNALDAVRERVRMDLELLATGGREAYLDDLFARMDQDEQKLKDLVRSAIDRIGARRLTMLILSLGSPVLAALIAALPEPWQARILTAALDRFIGRTLRSVKEALSGTPEPVLRSGLKALDRLLADPGVIQGVVSRATLGSDGSSWWERFFGNSTIVRNFLVTIVVVASIGVAIGLAIAGSTAAPIVAVVGALVALIALLNSDHITQAASEEGALQSAR